MKREDYDLKGFRYEHILGLRLLRSLQEKKARTNERASDVEIYDFAKDLHDPGHDEYPVEVKNSSSEEDGRTVSIPPVGGDVTPSPIGGADLQIDADEEVTADDLVHGMKAAQARLQAKADIIWRLVMPYIQEHEPPWEARGHRGHCGQSCGCCKSHNPEDGANCEECYDGWVTKTVCKTLKGHTQDYAAQFSDDDPAVVAKI